MYQSVDFLQKSLSTELCKSECKGKVWIFFSSAVAQQAALLVASIVSKRKYMEAGEKAPSKAAFSGSAAALLAATTPNHVITSAKVPEVSRPCSSRVRTRNIFERQHHRMIRILHYTRYIGSTLDRVHLLIYKAAITQHDTQTVALATNPFISAPFHSTINNANTSSERGFFPSYPTTSKNCKGTAHSKAYAFCS